MTPNFALSLSFDGIELRHRQGTDWALVGAADVASNDLSADLAALKAQAETLGLGPVQTQIVLPDDQIRFLAPPAEGREGAALRSAARAALDGATPYDVDDLAFDFHVADGTLHIAAVARETLAEAEHFALEHGFEPLQFVAALQPERFTAAPEFEANFGPTAFAETLPAPAAENVAARKDEKEAARSISVAPEPELAPQPVPAPKAPPEPEPEPPEPMPTVGFSSRRAAAPLPLDAKSVVPELTPEQPGAAPEPPVAPPANADQDAPRIPLAPPRIETANVTLPPAPPITGRSEATLDETQVSAASLRPGIAEDPSAFEPEAPRLVAPQPAPEPARTGGYSWQDPSFAAAPAPEVSASQPESDSPLNKAAGLARDLGGRALSGLGGALAARKARAEEKKALTQREAAAEAAATLSAEPIDEDPQTSEEQRMTVFGARKPKRAETVEVGGKPRFLGLILTAILLLFLVTVAAWASVFLDEGLARFWRSTPTQPQLAENTPELPASAAESFDAPTGEASGEIRTASLGDGLSDIDADILPSLTEALPEPEPAPPALTPEEAAARYAATGIWQIAPVQPQLPAPLSLDDVYTASIDSTIQGADAYALPAPKTGADQAPTQLASPLPPQSDIELGPDGLVVATPDGAMSPDGVMVYAGRPPVVPPTLPERLRQLRTEAETAAETGETEVATDEDDAQLALLTAQRPKLRPATLAESTERSQLGGMTRAELAKLRPRPRPRVEKEEIETETAEAPALAQAVAVSRKPSARPRGFDRKVKTARQAAAAASTAAPESGVQPAPRRQVAPRAVKPKVPSKASVARAATVKNAINLSRVNLVGVYGKPSSRRALVRLSTGRYKKVKVGDRIDGGRVSAIGESRLNYTKNGRSITLKMPRG